MPSPLTLLPLLKATSASPVTFLDSIGEFVDDVNGAISGAATVTLRAFRDSLKRFENTILEFNTAVQQLNEANIKLVFNLLNATTEASKAAMTELNNLRDRVTSPSISTLVQNIVTNANKLPARIVEELVPAATDFASTLQELADITDGKSNDIIKKIVQDFDDLFTETSDFIRLLGVIAQDNAQELADKLGKTANSIASELTALTKSGSAEIREAAQNALEKSQELIEAINTTLKTVAEVAKRATNDVATTIAKSVQNLIDATLGNAFAVITNVANSAINAAQQARELAQQRFVAGEEALKSYINKLNPLGLLSKSVDSSLKNLKTATINFANQTEAAILNLRQTAADFTQSSAAKLNNTLTTLFADATINIQDALNSGSDLVRQCAEASLAGTEATLKAAADLVKTCSEAAMNEINSKVDAVLDQLTNALDANSQLSDAARECIEAYQADNNAVVATSCLTSTNTKIAAQSAMNAVDLLVINLNTVATVALAEAEVCASKNVATAGQQVEITMNTFNQCVSSASA